MKVSELQIGDWVSCLGDPVSVVSLSFNDDVEVECDLDEEDGQ